MPISFACPYCGKQTSVADQYAGQSGPCAGCGKQVTIPFPSKPSAATTGTAAAAAGGVSAVVIILGVAAVVLLGCIGVLAALLLPAVQAAREAARRSQSANNMKQIALALHNYHDVHGSFPPAVVTDANGNALYSGRVLLLPFMEQQALYQAFNKDKAWNSPENEALSKTTIPTFLDPSNPAAPNANPGRTDYVFVTGTGTIFEGDKAVQLRDITDGTSNTLVTTEVKNSNYNWAEPRDLDFSNPTITLDSNHPGVTMVGFADGSVRPMAKNTPPQQIRALSTRGGGEVVQY